MGNSTPRGHQGTCHCIQLAEARSAAQRPAGHRPAHDSRSVTSDSLRPPGLTVAHQAPLSMGFSRQEYWSGLPRPSSGDLPNPGIEPGSSELQADSLPSELPGKPTINRVVQPWMAIGQRNPELGRAGKRESRREGKREGGLPMS